MRKLLTISFLLALAVPAIAKPKGVPVTVKILNGTGSSASFFSSYSHDYQIEITDEHGVVKNLLVRGENKLKIGDTNEGVYDRDKGQVAISHYKNHQFDTYKVVLEIPTERAVDPQKNQSDH